MGILEVLTIIFIVLKVIHVISWSWWVVLSPELLSLVVAGLTLVVAAKVIKKIK